MDPFCQVATAWKLDAERRGRVVSKSCFVNTILPALAFLPILDRAADETDDTLLKHMVDCTTHDDTEDEPYIRDVLLTSTASCDVSATDPLVAIVATDCDRPLQKQKQSKKRSASTLESCSEYRGPVVLYGTHMLKYNASHPKLEVHAPMKLDKLSFDAKCKWVDVPELSDMWFASMNLAGEALRHINAKLPIKPRVLTCDVFKSLTTDPTSEVRLHDLRKQSKMDRVFP